MKITSIAFAVVLASAAATILHGQVVSPTNLSTGVGVGADAQIIEVDSKNSKAAEKKKVKKKAKAKSQTVHEKQKGQKAKVKRAQDPRARGAATMSGAKAPRDRDMLVLLGAGPLALLGPDVVYADLPDDRFLTYRNCPPGLAKKDPPCVPPGLAQKGVTYEDWVSYDAERLDAIYLDQRRDYLDDGFAYDDEELSLGSDQIESLYGLRPAPEGSRYALIDGQPVLLEDEDHRSLLTVRRLAQTQNLPAGTIISPTAALTQDELRQVYNLPRLEPGYNYAVVNGELVTLADSAFDMLQMIRIARSVF